MTENTTPKEHQRRIAAAQQRRPRVDAQGKRIGKPSRFVYDEDGLLVSAESDDSAEE